MTKDHETALRESASFAWNKAYQMWQERQKQMEDDKNKDKPIDPTKPEDTQEGGGHGFVTFIIIVIVLAILGALAYVLHKLNKNKE